MADTYGFMDGSQYNLQGQQLAPPTALLAPTVQVNPTTQIDSSLLTQTPKTSLDIQSLLQENVNNQDKIFNQIQGFFTPTSEEQQYQQQYTDYQTKLNDLAVQQDKLALDTNAKSFELGRQPILTAIANSQISDTNIRAGFQQQNLAVQQSTLSRQQNVALQTLQNAQANRTQKLEAAKFLYQASRDKMADTIALYKATAPENIGNVVDAQTGEMTVIMKNPITGEVSRQNLGMVQTPAKWTMNIEDAKAGNIKTQFWTRDGKTIINTNTGREYSTPEQFFADGGSFDHNFLAENLTQYTPQVKKNYDLKFGPDGTAFKFDPATGNYQIVGYFPKPDEGNTLNNEEAFRMQLQLKKDYDSINKTSTIAGNSYNEINAAYTQALRDLKDGKSLNASSQAMIVAFNKLIDPTSVVRESEYARTPEGQSLINRISGKITQLQQGGAGLTQADLKGLVETADELVKGFQQQSFEQALITQQAADQYGLNLNLILPKSVIDSLPSTSSTQSGSRLTPLSGSPSAMKELAPLVQKYPYSEVWDIVNSVPGITESELKQALQAEGYSLGKTNGSIPPTSPVAPAAIKFPEGTRGGQCTTFLHTLVAFPSIGDGKKSKFASVDKFGIPANQWRKDIRVGDVVVTGDNPTYGHTFMVNAILPNGKVQVTESNWKGDERVSHSRIVSINNAKIYGAIRGNFKLKSRRV